MIHSLSFSYMSCTTYFTLLVWAIFMVVIPARKVIPEGFLKFFSLCKFDDNTDCR